MKNANPTDTKLSTPTKKFASWLPGSTPPPQNVKPAGPNSHRSNRPIPIVEVTLTYLLSKLKITETSKLTTMQLTIGK